MASHKESTAAARVIARDRADDSPRVSSSRHAAKPVHDAASSRAESAAKSPRCLQYDAHSSRHWKTTPTEASTSAHAALNVGRSIGERAVPDLATGPDRVLPNLHADGYADSGLGRAEHKGLAELQAAYRAEADEPYLLYGLRGERAALHRIFDGLESGKLTSRTWRSSASRRQDPLQHAVFTSTRACCPATMRSLWRCSARTLPPRNCRPTNNAPRFAAIPIPPGPPEELPLHHYSPLDPGLREGRDCRAAHSRRTTCREHRDRLRAISAC